MSRCQYTHHLAGHLRCTANATHYVRDDNGKRVSGVWCEKHARECVIEYREKLGWNWTMERIEEGHDGCIPRSPGPA